MSKIGVFDSGLGGLTVLFNLNNSNEYVYVADQKNNPYGEKTIEQLLDYSKKIVDFLISKGCDKIVIACNTVSANVSNELRKIYNEIEIIDVITETVKLINSEKYEKVKKILLIATEKTIESNMYQKLINKEVKGIATKDIVPAIENLASKKEIIKIIDRYLEKEKGKHDAILLGCTHYPIIKKEIEKYLQIKSIDSISAVSKYVDNISTKLDNNNNKNNLNDIKNDKYSNLEIYTTKDEKYLEKQIKEIFNKDIKVKILK